MPNSVTKKSRNPSMEAFRCLLMFLIVLSHSFWHGIYGQATALWTIFFLVFIRWHVNAFVSISGWYGIRFSWSKVLRLVGVMGWYSALSLIYVWVSGAGISWKNLRISGGWYGETYLLLMMLAPFLNSAVDNMSKGFAKCCWGGLAVIYGLIWLPGHLGLPLEPQGLSQGMDIFGFIFLYISAKMLHKFKFEKGCARVTNSQMAYGIVGYVLCVAICGLAAIGYNIVIGRAVSGRMMSAFSASYNAPQMWFFALLMLSFFATRVKVPQWTSRFFLFLSPSMFGVYLLHDTTSFGRLLYIYPQKWLMANSSLHPVLIIFITSIVCFGVCALADLVRRFALWWVRGSIDRVLASVDEKWLSLCQCESFGTSVK